MLAHDALLPSFWLVLLLALGTYPAAAEDIYGADSTASPPATEDSTPVILTGTLKKIRDSGVVTIGYREASFPFSYVRQVTPPNGYSIDLCVGIADEIRRELPGAQIRVGYQLVTADTRMEAVTSGKIDLECGSTTSNIERQKRGSRSRR